MTAGTAQNPVPAWGATNNFVHPRGPVFSPDTGAFADRQLITETIHRYGWGYDERREDVLGACFTEDAVFLGSVAGSFDVGPHEGRARIVDWLKAFWETQVDQRRHCVLNIVIDDLTEASATVLAFLLLTGAENGVARVVTTGFYRIRMAKQEGRWRIAHFFAGFDTGF